MLSYILKQLIRYNVHLGHYYWECNNLLGYFLLGVRNLITIINIYNTIYNLKKILYIVYNLGLIKQRILLANNIHYPIKSYLHKLNKNLIYINKKWTGGLLTNQKELYIYNKDLFYKFYDLGYRSILPAFVFTTNIENNSSCVFEAMVLDIINSSLFDTNLNYYGIFYKICSNDENYAIMAYFIRIIAKTFIKSTYIDLKNILLKQSNIQLWKKKKKKYNERWVIWKKLYKNYKKKKYKKNWKNNFSMPKMQVFRKEDLKNPVGKNKKDILIIPEKQFFFKENDKKRFPIWPKPRSAVNKNLHKGNSRSAVGKQVQIVKKEPKQMVNKNLHIPEEDHKSHALKIPDKDPNLEAAIRAETKKRMDAMKNRKFNLGLSNKSNLQVNDKLYERGSEGKTRDFNYNKKIIKESLPFNKKKNNNNNNKILFKNNKDKKED